MGVGIPAVRIDGAIVRGAGNNLKIAIPVEIRDGYGTDPAVVGGKLRFPIHRLRPTGQKGAGVLPYKYLALALVQKGASAGDDFQPQVAVEVHEGDIADDLPGPGVKWKTGQDGAPIVPAINVISGSDQHFVVSIEVNVGHGRR